MADEEQIEYYKGMRLPKELVDSVEGKMVKMGMFPFSHTETVKYCLNRWLEIINK